MNKLGKGQARPLADVVRTTIRDAFARQGFASTELVTRWPEIVGAEIAAHCEPDRIHWPRANDGDQSAPGTLVLRVEGPTGIEIQHQSRIVLDRVNRFFGWHAVAELRLRQAPLGRRTKPTAPVIDEAAAQRIAASLSEIRDEKLRQALGRLGAGVGKP
jgi:hypothetical protein